MGAAIRSADSRSVGLRRFRRLYADESGQAITEYILILSAAIATALTFSRALLRGISQGVLALGAQLEKDLKTGRVSIGIWKN